MRRGDIWWIDLDPAMAAEAAKIRPAVVVSNDDTNRAVERLGRGVVTVVPLTTNVRRIYAFQVAMPASVTGLSADSKAQAEQVRAVSWERLRSRAGRLPPALITGVDRALRLHLDL